MKFHLTHAALAEYELPSSSRALKHNKIVDAVVQKLSAQFGHAASSIAAALVSQAVEMTAERAELEHVHLADLASELDLPADPHADAAPVAGGLPLQRAFVTAEPWLPDVLPPPALPAQPNDGAASARTGPLRSTTKSTAQTRRQRSGLLCRRGCDLLLDNGRRVPTPLSMRVLVQEQLLGCPGERSVQRSSDGNACWCVCGPHNLQTRICAERKYLYSRAHIYVISDRCTHQTNA